MYNKTPMKNSISDYVGLLVLVLLVYLVFKDQIPFAVQKQVQPAIPVQPTPAYPLNFEVASNFGSTEVKPPFVEAGSADKLITIVHKVTYNPIISEYMYTYKLSTIATEKFFLHWGLLENILKVSAVTTLPAPNLPLVELEAGKPLEFVIQSKNPPVLTHSEALIYKKRNDTVWETIKITTQAIPFPK